MEDAPKHRLNVLPGMESFMPPETKKIKYRPNGYAAPPGTGPVGETCRTCDYFAAKRYSKNHLKCELMKAHWTNSYGTDIRAPRTRGFGKSPTRSSRLWMSITNRMRHPEVSARRADSNTWATYGD